jgi:hypothetical protein
MDIIYDRDMNEKLTRTLSSPTNPQRLEPLGSYRRQAKIRRPVPISLSAKFLFPIKPPCRRKSAAETVFLFRPGARQKNAKSKLQKSPKKKPLASRANAREN